MSVPVSPISAAHFTNCTKPAASSFRIPGMWAARAICRDSASRRWPPPVPDSRGRMGIDGGMSRDRVLDHLTEMVEATDLPINADFENGFAPDAAGVAISVKLAVESGVAGLSIEDSTGNPSHPLHDVDTAVERLRAARKAIDKAGGDTLLVGRAECFLHGQTDLDHTIHRLKAYANAGADCLYAPGIRTAEQIRAVVAGAAPKPVNLLMGWPGDLTVSQIADLGVRRISIGGALARAAWGGFMRAAKLIVEQGKFDGFANAASGSELDAFFRGS